MHIIPLLNSGILMKICNHALFLSWASSILGSLKFIGLKVTYRRMPLNPFKQFRSEIEVPRDVRNSKGP